MNRDQFTLYASSLIRHLLTLGAGLLVARGFTGTADTLSNLTAAIAVFGATLGWSFIQKHKLLAALCGALDPSALEQLLQQTITLRKNGADPLLIAHMAGTALAVAQGELAAVSNLAPGAATAAPPVTQDVQPAPAPAPSPSGSSPSGVAQEPDVSSGMDSRITTDGVTP